MNMTTTGSFFVLLEIGLWAHRDDIPEIFDATGMTVSAEIVTLLEASMGSRYQDVVPNSLNLDGAQGPKEVVRQRTTRQEVKEFKCTSGMIFLDSFLNVHVEVFLKVVQGPTLELAADVFDFVSFLLT